MNPTDGVVLPIEPLPEGMSVVKEWSWPGGVVKDYALPGDPEKGAQIAYYGDGKRRFYFPTIDGKYTGTCKTWYPGGLIESESFYCEGIQEGICRIWHLNGVLKAFTEFKKGRRHGSCRRWHENGLLKTDSFYVNDLQEGTTKEWDDKGTLRAQTTYSRDFRHGVSKRWYENGNVSYSCHYERGGRHGLEKEWHPDGKLKRERSYRADQLHGMMKEYDREGKLALKSFIVNWIPIGPELTETIEKGALNAGHILRERNAAVRRACLEVLGYARFLSQVTHKVLSREGDSELVRIDWHKREESIYLVKVKCPSTGAYYALRVPPTVKTIKEAVAWTFETEGSEYSPLEEA